MKKRIFRAVLLLIIPVMLGVFFIQKNAPAPDTPFNYLEYGRGKTMLVLRDHVVFPALISVFLPAYILQYRRILYLLPFPTGPLLTNGYYMNMDASTGLQFADIPVKTCIGFLAALVLAGVLFYIIGGVVNLRRNRL